MPGIPDHVIDEIRDRADILEIVGEVVPLKRRGKNWVGLCPFHPEKTPSFNVSPDKQMYYCFGCQAGGNVFTFLVEHERLAFPDAVRVLGDRVGVEVPEAVEAGPDPFAPLYRANALAAGFYHRQLVEGDDGEAARAYLAGRGIAERAWEAFQLGWAPDRWEALVGEVGRQGGATEPLVEAGLAARSEKTGGLYDRFRGRVVFPIRSVGGKIVAFSGRRLDDEEPKYLNSSDSPIFTKGRTVFNLDLARGPIRREGAAIVVEGNFDVVRLHEAGFRNVVAPLGTSLTEAQARVLKRYTTTVYLAYDGDAAGERAAFRAADLLLAAGFAARIVPLPAGRDPDDLVAAEGAGAFAALLEAARDVVDAKIAVVQERVDLGDVMTKRRAIRRLLDTVRRVPDPITRSLYLDRIAADLDVPRAMLDRAGGRDKPKKPTEPTVERPAGRGAPGGIVPPAVQDERYVLLHAVNDPDWLGRALGVARPEFFTEATYAAFFLHLREHDPADEEALERLRGREEPEVQRILAELELWREESGFPLAEETFRDALQRLLLKAVDRGVLPELERTGERLKDALLKRELERAIRRGRWRSEAVDDEADRPTD